MNNKCDDSSMPATTAAEVGAMESAAEVGATDTTAEGSYILATATAVGQWR